MIIHPIVLNQMNSIKSIKSQVFDVLKAIKIDIFECIKKIKK